MATVRPAASPACLPIHVPETVPAENNRLIHVQSLDHPEEDLLPDTRRWGGRVGSKRTKQVRAQENCDVCIVPIMLPTENCRWKRHKKQETACSGTAFFLLFACLLPQDAVHTARGTRYRLGGGCAPPRARQRVFSHSLVSAPKKIQVRSGAGTHAEVKQSSQQNICRVCPVSPWTSAIRAACAPSSSRRNNSYPRLSDIRREPYEEARRREPFLRVESHPFLRPWLPSRLVTTTTAGAGRSHTRTTPLHAPAASSA